MIEHVKYNNYFGVWFMLFFNVTYTTVLDILEEERKNPDVWDKLNGCRKGRHVFEDKYQHKNKAKPLHERTAGLLGYKSQNNFILYLEEELYRETPTGCIVATTTFLTSNAITIAYAERMTGWGWDMMCCLYPRMRTLITLSLLPPLQITLLITSLEYLYVDTFHVSTHVNKLCQKVGGLFHPYLDKFKGLLYALKKKQKNNDSTCEQEWRDTNRIRFAKNLKRSNSAIFWYAYRKRHNERNMRKLRKQGYTFVPISQVSKARDLSIMKDSSHLPSTKDLLTLERYQNLKKPQLLLQS